MNFDFTVEWVSEPAIPSYCALLRHASAAKTRLGESVTVPIQSRAINLREALCRMANKQTDNLRNETPADR